VRVNTAKQRMLDGKPALGVGAGLGSPLAAELLSLAGYDFVMIDCQHGSWDVDTSMSAFRSICVGPAVPMVRVGQHDFYAIGGLLDRGALGIIVPMVDTVEEAEMAASAVRYPPRGRRSCGFFGAQFHGSDYMERIDEEVFLAVQRESRQAVEQAEAIMAVDGIDGCWIGPHDLAKSMGVDPETGAGKEAHEAAILRVLEACRRTGKIPGIFAGQGQGQHRIDQGFLFVTVGDDLEFVSEGAGRTLRLFKAGEPPSSGGIVT